MCGVWGLSVWWGECVLWVSVWGGECGWVRVSPGDAGVEGQLAVCRPPSALPVPRGVFCFPLAVTFILTTLMKQVLRAPF